MKLAFRIINCSPTMSFTFRQENRTLEHIGGCNGRCHGYCRQRSRAAQGALHHIRNATGGRRVGGPGPLVFGGGRNTPHPKQSYSAMATSAPLSGGLPRPDKFSPTDCENPTTNRRCGGMPDSPAASSHICNTISWCKRIDSAGRPLVITAVPDFAGVRSEGKIDSGLAGGRSPGVRTAGR